MGHRWWSAIYELAVYHSFFSSKSNVYPATPVPVGSDPHGVKTSGRRHGLAVHPAMPSVGLTDRLQSVRRRSRPPWTTVSGARGRSAETYWPELDRSSAAAVNALQAIRLGWSPGVGRETDKTTMKRLPSSGNQSLVCTRVAHV
jgi:hypothetical protein